MNKPSEQISPTRQWEEKPIEELGGRTWEELEVTIHESGRKLFDDCLRQVGKSGKLEAIKVKVWVPYPMDLAEARRDCAKLCKELELDRDKDADVFDNLEQICILCRCIRTAKEPHPQFESDPRVMGTRYDEGSLMDILGRINAMKGLLDPRRDEPVDDEDFWRKVVSVAKAGHLLPLTDIAGHAQPSFIVRMAAEACLSPQAKPYVQSQEI